MKKTSTVFIISGPLGVGKTSVARQTSQNVENCELVVGDDFFVPLEEDTSISWDERLEISWKKVLSKTKKHILNGKNVVIDFVVEDELEWFYQKISVHEVVVKYVVLVADEKTLKKRLSNRSDIKYIKRSLVLLDKLINDPRNEKFLLDTTSISTNQAAKAIIRSNNFIYNSTSV